jgi:nucleotide-binding universal stress UspA family protein
MRHILVPTDFSDTAQAALVYAVDLCRDLRGRLTVLHVVFAEKYENEFPGLDAFGYLSASANSAGRPEGTILQWKALAFEKLNSSIDPKWRDGLSIETVVAEGRPSKAIVEHACKHKGDMIVMGTHGRGPVANFFLGSVTENVLRSADCPVVVVRGH